MPDMHQISHARTLCVLTIVLASSSAALASVPGYNLVGTYTGQSQRWDVLSDGRLISIDANGTISRQDSVNSSSFSVVGSIDASLLNQSGASFISVSPDGSTIAIGDGNFGGASVYTIQTSSLSTTGNSAVSGFSVGNFSADWIDNTTLAIAGSDNTTFAAVVTQLDVTNGNTQILVNDMAGFSADIVVNGGFLYAGNGFATGGPSDSQTGEVRAFALGDITNSTLSFEAQGIAVTDLLSAGSLDFDADGNLLVGGGDLFGGSGDFGYIGVVDSEDLDAALLGGSIATAALELTPDPAIDFNTVRFNDATGEVLIEAGGTIYRYQVPAPASTVLAFGALACVARRRRNA